MEESCLPITRDHRTDELKGLSILAVVTIHTGMPFSESLRFCVPVFIALWAYHHEQGIRRNGQIWKYTFRRFTSLFLPYCFWTAIYLLFFPPTRDWTTLSPQTMINGLLGGYGWPGQYFFIILFQLIWLFPFCRGIATNRSLLPILAAGTVLNTLALYVMSNNNLARAVGDRLFIYWLPYVWIGLCLANGFPRPSKLYYLGLLFLTYAPQELGSAPHYPTNLSPYLFPTVTIGSILMLLAMGPRTDQGNKGLARNILRPIRSIGRHSLCIFTSHMLIIQMAWNSRIYNSISGIGALRNIGLVFIAIIGSLFLGYLLKRLKLGVFVGG